MSVVPVGPHEDDGFGTNDRRLIKNADLVAVPRRRNPAAWLEAVRGRVFEIRGGELEVVAEGETEVVGKRPGCEVTLVAHSVKKGRGKDVRLHASLICQVVCRIGSISVGSGHGGVGGAGGGSRDVPSPRGLAGSASLISPSVALAGCGGFTTR